MSKVLRFACFSFLALVGLSMAGCESRQATSNAGGKKGSGAD
ncbi:MAG: hypothetical protein RJB11_2579, partial [Planctomycetota bacterium]